MRLELAIHCYNYQKRLCWMLSSILQQKGEIPDVETSVAFLPNSGNPTCESVIDFFRTKGLNIVAVPLEKGQESNRAISRNIRTKNTTADWMLYADSDLVYDPYFFEDLKKSLEDDKFKNETKVMGADRHSLDINFCTKYFEEDKTEYPCVIENVSTITEKWPKFRVGGAEIAAGYFQLANVNAIKEKGGFYVKRQGDLWRHTKSDRTFRVHMGGRVPLPVKPIYHLNHDRGSPQEQH
jgi:hypothetical protein